MREARDGSISFGTPAFGSKTRRFGLILNRNRQLLTLSKIVQTDGLSRQTDLIAERNL